MVRPVRKHKPMLHPAYWPTWLGLALFWLIGQIPWNLLLLLGRGLGHIAWHLAKRRRHIAQINIDLCFPELTPEKRLELCRATVTSTMEAFAEMAGSYCNRYTDLGRRLTIKGREHVDQARRDGRGVLLLGMHFNSIDVGSRLLGEVMDFSVVYRPNDNAVLDWLIRNGRGRHVKHSIDRRDLRQLVRLLKAGEVVWYAPDQDYGLKHAVFAPFFNQPAATITATSRIARMSKAAVIPCAHYRLPKGRYVIEFGAPLENFPTKDDVRDASVINSAIENYVRKAPEQYLWVHRRFKHQPPGSESPYQVHRQ